MNASFVWKLLSRLVMVGAVAAGIVYLLMSKPPEKSATNGKPEEIHKKSHKTTDKETVVADDSGANLHGLEGRQEFKLTDTSSKSALMALPKREWRKIQVIHLHLPKDAESLALARSIEEIRIIYPEHVLVSTIDVSNRPGKLAEWSVSRAPSIVFQTEGQRLSSLEEVWPVPRLTQKIEELIHGLVRVDKHWRPEVKGLEKR